MLVTSNFPLFSKVFSVRVIKSLDCVPLAHFKGIWIGVNGIKIFIQDRLSYSKERYIGLSPLQIFLSHNNTCFQCNIVITNFLVLHTCEIRFHDVIGPSTVHMYSYAKISKTWLTYMAKWVFFGPLFFNLIFWIQLYDRKNLTFFDCCDKILLYSSWKYN